MTMYLDDIPLADDVPVADAAEQLQPADVSVEDAGLDTRYVANLIKRDANPADVIDQAIIVPIPDDDRDVDPCSKRRQHRCLRGHLSCRGSAGSCRKGGPMRRGRRPMRRHPRPGTGGSG